MLLVMFMTLDPFEAGSLGQRQVFFELNIMAFLLSVFIFTALENVHEWNFSKNRLALPMLSLMLVPEENELVSSPYIMSYKVLSKLPMSLIFILNIK